MKYLNYIFKNSFNGANQKAFTLMEIMVVLAISSLLMGLSLQVFKSISEKQMVEKEAEIVYSILQKAHDQAVAGVDGMNFGVKFASTTITLFRGTGYSAASTTNQVTTLGTRTEVSWINLTAGTSTVYFAKISGKPSATGTIEIVLKSDPTLKEVIIIHGSGLTEVQ